MDQKETSGLRLRFRRWLKKVFDNAGNEKLRLNFLQALPFWVASIITGLIAVFYSRLFLFAEHETAGIFQKTPWLLFIITPSCFLIAWWVVQRFAIYARGSGIPQVMAAIELSDHSSNNLMKRLLGIRIILVKVVSSFFMIMGGGVIGREGPTIQIAGSVFSKINEWLPRWWPKISRVNMIMTGAAAGLAAAFNTPLGGIVFAVEELTKTHISHFKTALFSAIIIAGLTAQALFGPYLYLGYPVVNQLSPYIFFGVLLVAMLAGLCGSGTARMMLVLFKWKSKFRYQRQHMAYIVIAGLIVASFAYFINPMALGSGKEIMTLVLFSPDKHLPWYMPILRMAGGICSFTTGAAGGVFAPSLTSGATIGSVISGWMELSPSDTNLLILSGMVAFLTGITRTPFTSAIIVLEMTDRHSLIFYLMMAGMVAGLVSVLVDKHSFYDHLKVQYLRELETVPEPAVEVPETEKSMP